MLFSEGAAGNYATFDETPDNEGSDGKDRLDRMKLIVTPLSLSHVPTAELKTQNEEMSRLVSRCRITFTFVSAAFRADRSPATRPRQYAN
jgi:hypothetical protein